MAQHPYISFLRQFLCWLVFFQFTRLVFAVWNWHELTGLPWKELVALPYHALYLDVATACYFMGIPCLLYMAASFTESQVFQSINRVFTLVLVMLVSILTIAELPIYDEWNTKLNYRAISFLRNPAEVLGIATSHQLGWGILGICLLSWAGIWCFNKWAFSNGQPFRLPWWQRLAFSILAPVLIVVGLRGGLQQIPIQVSDAYYSQHNVLNLAATNSTFHLISSCTKNYKIGKPYQFMWNEEAQAVFDSLHHVPQDTTTRILTTPRPNIVMVILEGVSADLIKSCGGYDSIMPYFDAMANEGLLFSNCYASGYRSDEGMAAIFSGFPAQPKTTIINEPNKYGQLPCLGLELEKVGYHTSFLFGGQLSYGNIRSYMYFNGFDRILELKDFDPDIPQGKLGVHDESLFERQLLELSKEQQPFFAGMFTQSTHSPYDMPMQREVIHWGGREQKYLNSAVYADSCIHDFMAKAKLTDWYSNTLFVFVSDHGHITPKHWSIIEPAYRKIPLLFFGEVIKPEYRGKRIADITSQTDLAATLLAQLGLSYGSFKYSKNGLNPTSPRHLFYSFDEGVCVLKNEGQLCWHVKDGHVDTELVPNPADKEKLLHEGRAYLQVLMQDFFGH